MKSFQVFDPVTRREIPVHYVSPAIDQLPESASGSSSGESLLVLETAPIVQLAGPSELTAVGANLSWSAVAKAQAYVIFSAPAPSGPWTIVTSGVIPTHFTVFLPPGTYYFRVTALEPDFGETLPSPVAGPVTL